MKSDVSDIVLRCRTFENCVELRTRQQADFGEGRGDLGLVSCRGKADFGDVLGDDDGERRLPMGTSRFKRGLATDAQNWLDLEGEFQMDGDVAYSFCTWGCDFVPLVSAE